MRSAAPQRATTADAPVLDPDDLLIASRFSCGLTPDLAQDITAAGGGRAWLVAQLQPSSVPDPNGDEVDSWFPYLARSTQEIYERSRSGTERIGAVMTDLSRRTVARRLQSRRQVQEVMVDFWSNLLHVPITHRDAAYARADYDQVIRTYALSSFEDLLQHAIVHPSMGINLNNNLSSKWAPNENLGRELLELHTVGVDSGYTEDDVKASAKLLTGYRVTLTKQFFDARYYPPSHARGPLKVMGFRTSNRDADGQAVTMDYLSYLAMHPATAQRIARRLCVKFVRDDPSDDLVQAVATAYTLNRTAIVPTLLAMVDHPAFRTSAGLKLRTPQEDWQAMVRALGITLRNPTSTRSFVSAMYTEYVVLDNAPYEWDAPNGYPEVNAAWSGAGRMLKTFRAHERMSSRSLPWIHVDADMPDLASLVPPTPVTLRSLVDAYAGRFFGVPSTKATRVAVSALLGRGMGQTVTPRVADKRWTLPGIVATLLDSPQHLYR